MKNTRTNFFAACMRLALAAGALAIGSAVLAQGSAATYSVTRIPMLSGVDRMTGRAINDSNEVVGSTSSAGSLKTAFYWKSGVNNSQPVAIPLLSGATYAYPLAINNGGRVIGYCSGFSSAPGSRVFSWKYGENGGQPVYVGPGASSAQINDADQVLANGKVYTRSPLTGEWSAGTLPPLPGDTASMGQAISDAGLIMGISFAEGPQHPVSWALDVSGAWQATSLPAVSGAIEYQFVSINASSQAVGWYFTGSANGSFFLDTNTSNVTTLGSLGRALGVNRDGQVTGWGTLSNEQRAFMWEPARGADNPLNLGTLGGNLSRPSGSINDDYYRALNDDGVIAGWSRLSAKGKAQQTPAGFVWDAVRGMRNLNAITPNAVGVITMTNAWAVNASGAITGEGTTKTNTAAYVLTPQP